MKTIALLFAFSFVLISNNSLCQEESKPFEAFAFEQRTFGKYFISNHYASNIRINGGAGLNLSDYNIDRERTNRYVLYNETVIGADIPFYILQWGEHALSFSLPLSFSVWFDFTENFTAPILNTDYRFALVEINYFKEVNKGFIKNFNLKWLPFAHESTHIGDELTIARIYANAPITRVNVSNEFTEFSITINDTKSNKIKNHAFNLGGRFLLNASKGWYSMSEYEGDTNLVKSSEYWIEPYFQYQFQDPNGFLAFKKGMFVLSANLAIRVKYGYPFYYEKDGSITEITLDESYKPSLNVLLGWKFLNSHDELSHFGAYFRAYGGINYHGQFRNIPKYQFYGLSFIYEH